MNYTKHLEQINAKLDFIIKISGHDVSEVEKAYKVDFDYHTLTSKVVEFINNFNASQELKKVTQKWIGEQVGVKPDYVRQILARDQDLHQKLAEINYQIEINKIKEKFKK